MKIKNKEIYTFYLSDFCIYFYWGIQMMAKGFAIDTTNPIYNMVTLLIVPLVLVKILIGRYKKKELIFSILISYVALFIALKTGNTQALIVILTIIALKGINLENLMKWSFILRGSTFLIRILLAFRGILDVEINRLGEYSFGFGHSNLAHGEFFCIVGSYILWKNKKLSGWDYIIINVLNIWLFSFTKSRTPFLLIICMMVLILISNYKIFRMILSKAEKYAFIGMLFISIICSRLYFEIAKVILWGTFGSRFQTGYFMQGTYDVTLFGSKMRYANDLGYLQLFYVFGIVWFLFFIIGHTVLQDKAIKEGRWALSAYLTAISLYFIMESYATSVLYNYGWLYFSILIFKDTGSKQNIKNYELEQRE